MNEPKGPRARFDAALAAAETDSEAFAALEALARETVGMKLFTVMTLDRPAMLARRAYSSEPRDYPVSGTKPIEMNDWLETVALRHETFVANTLEDIAAVFPDHRTIGALGCGSVVNLPVVLDGELAATINLLHEPHHFTAERVDLVTATLAEPARAAVQWAARFNGGGSSEPVTIPGVGLRTRRRAPWHRRRDCVRITGHLTRQARHAKW